MPASDRWSAKRGTNNLGKIYVERTHLHAAKRDRHGMLTWIARLDDRCRMLQCCRAVVFVLVRRRGVMMSRVVVIVVLVDVQRRQHSRRRDEPLNEHERDDTTHGDSLLRDLKDLQLLLPAHDQLAVHQRQRRPVVARFEDNGARERLEP
jgi:hypothetical protein